VASLFPNELRYGTTVLTLNTNEVYLQFSERFFDKIEAYTENYGLAPVQTDTIPFRSSTINKSETARTSNWYAIKEKTLDQQFESMLSDERVQLASPVYYRNDLLPRKTGITFSDFILIKVKAKTSLMSVKNLFKNFGSIAGRQIKLADGDLYQAQIKDPKQRNALEVADEIAKLSGVIKEARPDFISLTPIFHRVPNDTYFADQWALQKINAPNAWDRSTGSPNVVIAIIDSGCDLNHEDLSTKYVSDAKRYNAMDGTHITNDSFGHGTCLAGIAAANSDNRIGVAGVAWRTKIMPIKIYEDENTGVQESGLLKAIDWAITHLAKVINMSWDWPGPENKISSALTKAHDAGIVLVASAGNYYAKEAPSEPPASPITFPANHSAVIAVGASDKDDRRKCYSSRDGQCWGSNFGDGLSVVSPGVLILTTDITGRGGFNDQNGPAVFGYVCTQPPYGPNGNSPNYNYCSTMGGTSGAAPFVSGLAALLLSYRSTLSNDEVRRAIEKTAEKVGGYPYVQDRSHHNGRWNAEMGYGRINVFDALKFVGRHIGNRKIKKKKR
jgi:subtilisin family serine protease